MKSIIALLAITAIVGAGLFMLNKNQLETSTIPTPVYDAWNHWKTANGKVYGGDAETQYRLSVFAENFKIVAAH
jgi:hypothetical protein